LQGIIDKRTNLIENHEINPPWNESLSETTTNAAGSLPAAKRLNKESSQLLLVCFEVQADITSINSAANEQASNGFQRDFCIACLLGFN